MSQNVVRGDYGKTNHDTDADKMSKPLFRDDDSKTNHDTGADKLLVYLPTALAVVTGLLSTVGGLTGGIARMFRNAPVLSYLTLVMAILAIALALVAQLVGHVRRKRFMALLVSAVGTFALSLLLGTTLAVQTAGVSERPTVTAKLTQSASGVWMLEGAASASGMKADGRLRVFIYAKPAAREHPHEELFFVTAGPNAEGVASQTFGVPLPTDFTYRSYVVTAATDGEVRYCDGTRALIGSRLIPTADTNNQGTNSCLVVHPPPRPSSQPSTSQGPTP